jgi:hypothetical protein
MKRTIKYLKSRSKAGKTVTPLKLYPSEFQKIIELGFYEVNGKEAKNDEKHQAWYIMSCDKAESGTLASKMFKLALKVQRRENRKKIQQMKHKNIHNIIKFEQKERYELYDEEGECYEDCDVCMFSHCNVFQFEDMMEMKG